LLTASVISRAQSSEGSMNCTVTGNVVVSSEEGKFKTYSFIQGGVKANEKVTLDYRVDSISIYIALKRNQKEKSSIIYNYLESKHDGTTAEKANGGFFIKESTHNHSISFMPDYIRINNFGEFVIRRYYKNDWHGILFNVARDSDFTTQTITFNCRHSNDKMEEAFKIFNGYKK